ncbi:MAG: hypothetical protein KJ558_08360 [Gammaproteobacteria bacterium]|nr:hypothetical protein [Gammaproteobacteria bacterium]MBU1654825.1 hypothetical protein [Gammaproteobacteria bacterium]MBU1961092.1 hypothetical protein [Gammaproteobacteria bacterium]
MKFSVVVSGCSQACPGAHVGIELRERMGATPPDIDEPTDLGHLLAELSQIRQLQLSGERT